MSNSRLRGRGVARITFSDVDDSMCLTPEIWSQIESLLDYEPLGNGRFKITKFLQFQEVMSVVSSKVYC